jgi:hypothetical protein
VVSTLTKRPIQIYLRPQQLEALRGEAHRRNVSIAELIRQGVDRILDEVPPEDDALWDLRGLVPSGPNDVSEKHDEHLARILREEDR